ncbi:NADH dehydrogenase [Corynespora cassiicola Philippines]|uniref:NADH dehydrogenase n=1 Tax=Corynespora cassiicola Philippines TaxID=1448308 RepID=A0A2T2PDD0_CORCC|nr:NADH dehydrogenase [Corynespora cassiicola Philippines]
MKYPTACVECRVAKIKCAQNPADPLTACRSCIKRSINCSRPWLEKHEQSGKPVKKPKILAQAPLPIPQSSDSDLGVVSAQGINEFVHSYFQFIHDRPHSLFHERSTWHDIKTGSIRECLLAAICALGCRFAPREQDRRLASRYALRSKLLFTQNLEEISIPSIQTCILLANHYAAERDNRLEALYFGIANRMAYILGIDKMNTTDSIISQEIKARVWRSLYMADRWCPPGLGLPHVIRQLDAIPRNLMDERAFQSLEEPTPLSTVECREGLWAYNIFLADILASIQELNFSLLQENVNRPDVDRQVDGLATQLQNWQDSLPSYMVMDEENLADYRRQGQGGTLVAMHLGYHHYSALLFFQYLEPDYEPNQTSKEYAARCRLHGLAFSRLLHTARKLGDCHVVYLTVVHMTMVSSSVILHSLLFGTEEEVDTARLQLCRNFEALIELSTYWPCVDQIKERLFIFQDACLRSSAAKTFSVDKWIIRFLMEHALPFEKKHSDNVESTAVAFSPNQHSTVSLERRTILDNALDNLRC